MGKFSRRDFLKLVAAFSGSFMLPSHEVFVKSVFGKQDKLNILILLFDAMSARHMSVYGYARETTPHLARLAERALVFHSHTSGGNFTTPGTASMLVGMYPWKHRAINAGGLIRRELSDQSIFGLLSDEYYRIAYSQNYLVDLFLHQFKKDIDLHIPAQNFDYRPLQMLVSQYLPDSAMGYYALDSFAFDGTNIPGSALWGYLDILYRRGLPQDSFIAKVYPYGLPDNHYSQYLNDVVYVGVADVLQQVATQHLPFFAYFHLYSPHAPYAPRAEFVGSLGDIKTAYKPRHKLASNHMGKKELDLLRKQYDEYIANVDWEIGKLMDALAATGVLQNTIVIFTADHGELFERGEYGHQTRLLFDPVIHIPLLVLLPGQRSRIDVYSPSSNIDLLPSLLHVAGRPIPVGLEGQILPGLGGKEDFSRSIFSMDAKENSVFTPLKRGTFSLTKGYYKLIYYMGHPGHSDAFELYDLKEDIEERVNLVDKEVLIAARMKDELLERLESENRLFTKQQ